MGGLDINWFRSDKGHDPEVIRKSIARRFRDPTLVDTIIQKDLDWRKSIRYTLDGLKKKWNEIGIAIKNKKIANKQDPCLEEIQTKNQNQLQQKAIETDEKNILASINQLINQVGNIVHDSVPVSKTEDQNRIERTWGTIPQLKITGKKGAMHHHEVLQAIGGYDAKRGQKVAGHRGYFLKGPGVLLNNALVSYGLHFLNKKKYELLQSPFFIRQEIMEETCQLSDFDEQLYKVTGKGCDPDAPQKVENYYLIATSEQPISAMHRGEWIEEGELPIRYCGTSSCFRKQAGAHGKDTWGIFRVHQFEKIQQFVISKPEDSQKLHDEMIGVAEEFMQSLKLPYRVVNIVSGALNDAAAKKYDLEAWFPGYEAYRELNSVSNCTDWQSRNLEVRCGMKKANEKEKKYVHMLNGTLCATERTMCCILENYQTEDGLRVPEVLQPYVGTDLIPFKDNQIKQLKGKERGEKKQKKDTKVTKEKKKETSENKGEEADILEKPQKKEQKKQVIKEKQQLIEQSEKTQKQAE